MAGPVSLRSQKALLTRYCNNLKHILDSCETDVRTEETSLRTPEHFESKQALIIELEATSRLVFDTLTTFTTMVDSIIDTMDENQEKHIQEYVDTAHAVLDRAQSRTIQLDAKLKSARAQSSWFGDATTWKQLPPINVGESLQAAQPKLPAIPIPTFSGKLWEFTNFWTLFSANVHNQPLSKLQKFNYLLKALTGDARDVIKRYPVTEENYDYAVELLKQKYNDHSKLIATLQSRLENARTERSDTQGQRQLLEYIIPIVTQLENLGVSLNGSYLAQKVLSKFATSIQRSILERHLSNNVTDDQWIMRDILKDLDNYITTEERINDMVTRNITKSAPSNRRANPRMFNSDKTSCMFCKLKSHKSATCLRYPSISERRALMQERKQCLNCGTEGHMANQCSSEGCRRCDGSKHHHTLCPQYKAAHRGINDKPRPTSERTSTTTQKVKEGQAGKRSRKGYPKPSLAHTIQMGDGEAATAQREQDPNHEHTVLHNTNMKNTHGDKVADVLLLTGCASVWNAKESNWREVEILFDTGADHSFISESLVKELGLECSPASSFTMYTFGATHPRLTECRRTTVDLCNRQGQRHTVQLHTTALLTAKGKIAQLSMEDHRFIISQGIALSKTAFDKATQPQILLGCDQLWSLLDWSGPHYTLPSGFLAIPSKLGYLLTGKQRNSGGNTIRNSDHSAQITTVINDLTDFESDLERWDKYWTIDSAGICEFNGSKDEEKKAVNEKVMEFFNRTIERRKDGYYVRLPYKENHAPLPDNKAIAMSRLHSVLSMLHTRPELLTVYAKTIQDQRKKGIIEEVTNDQEQTNGTLHYIPHQPVITPHKRTTKLRIVFDASSHFKGCPSLNDILHQGPLILPELYAMLLRFRMPSHVATADVEKAFLQVRIHECDRDATRFLWVRDVNKPARDGNVMTYRFTRVTFGLSVSPFLLGGTIHHHLRTSVQDHALAQEIRDNLYVDNLILTGNCTKKIVTKSLEARKIFAEMGMNLREFLSNDPQLRNKLPENACADNTVQKVLGVTWNAVHDTLIIQCQFPKTDMLSKRVVAKQIASIYDPFGWLVPLLTRAKRFQQELWKQRFAWDEELPPELKNEWNEISQNADDFKRCFPRRFLTDASEHHLAVFVDASDIAIAACAYIFNAQGTSLAMAKSKLPSIKSKMTMPKLEISALTLGARLSLSICDALNQQALGSTRKIYLFSDSQISLSWVTSSTHKASLGRLVENRLREIEDIVKTVEERGLSVQFLYVPTTTNPADAGTRGLTKSQLENHFWWSGPTFLRTPENTWPTTTYVKDPEKSAVSRGPVMVFNSLTASNNDNAIIDLTRFSSLLKAQRVILVALVFLKKTLCALDRDRRDEILSSITILQELPENITNMGGRAYRAARFLIIRSHQSTLLTEEYRKLLERLRPFQDQEGIWRSEGRLNKSALTGFAKKPILIAPKSTLADLLIKEAHGVYHQGVAHTMATVRTKYWIPRLRQQVRTLVQNCVKCRRFNSLPYAYPNCTNWPARRVLRSYPFQHIGVDFFDLPSSLDGTQSTTCGCIFTCMITRLIHLEMLSSMSAEDFINALRRFVARRGSPETITCDNAPTFLLTEQILNEQFHDNDVHPEVIRAAATKEIQWRHITPYAPWQGGFYERLIKSVKHALYKALRGSNQRTGDHLRTILTEIEACLNSRPLTYQGAEQEELTSVRPIDFLQKSLHLTLSIETINQTSKEDLDYHAPEEIRALRTRTDVLNALHSSCSATEKFWKIWSHQYLTSLRETHGVSMSHGRQSKNTPKVGDVVLVSDPVLPRNDWKMARIIKLIAGSDGNAREAQLITSTKRTIRRPVNLLVPLEISARLDDEGIEEKTNTEHANAAKPLPPSHSYNLRPRPEQRKKSVFVTSIHSKPASGISRKWFLFHIMLLSFILQGSVAETTSPEVTCMGDRILIATVNHNESIEVCADRECQTHILYKSPYRIKFPPHTTLHDHQVVLKWNMAGQLFTLTTVCNGVEFCTNIDCWFCSPVLLNPECRPKRALLMFFVFVYASIAAIYLLLYVPMTIGKPIRIFFKGLAMIFIYTTRKITKCCLKFVRSNRRTPTRNERVAAALAIIACFNTLSRTEMTGCQHVNVFEHHSTTCLLSQRGEKCTIKLTEVLKLNTFKQSACLRVTHNSSLIANIKIKWKGLHLHCKPETQYFTRSTITKIKDSKRCPHMGSCIGEKCANVNASSLLPELYETNSFPGRTGCMESCGGLGCDCFYPSSGCLFYRIYAVPKTETIYEIFRCAEWIEDVKLDITIERLDALKGAQRFTRTAVPNVPITLPLIQITLTSLSVPPTSVLNYNFISNGQDISIWRSEVQPRLRCPTAENAAKVECSLNDDCRCTAAEDRVNCHCSEIDVESEFQQLHLKLPVKTASWELRRSNNVVKATIPHLVSAEFVVDFEHNFDTAYLLRRKHTCVVDDSELMGCYKCAKGAQTRIHCKSQADTNGEILCGYDAFVVPCGPSSPESLLRFQLNAAKQFLNCSISCGNTPHYFVLSGILKYVGRLPFPPLTHMQGNTSAYHEIQWPDFYHIVDVFMSWYKTLLVGFMVVGIALLLSYAFLPYIGARILSLCIRGLIKLMYCPIKIIIHTLKTIRGQPLRNLNEQMTTHLKNI